MFMRLIPRRQRFSAALIVARMVVEPLVRARGARYAQGLVQFDGAAETALHLVLDRMTSYGTTFDPVLKPCAGRRVEVGEVPLQDEIEATSSVAPIRREGANCIQDGDSRLAISDSRLAMAD